VFVLSVSNFKFGGIVTFIAMDWFLPRAYITECKTSMRGSSCGFRIVSTLNKRLGSAWLPEVCANICRWIVLPCMRGSVARYVLYLPSEHHVWDSLRLVSGIVYGLCVCQEDVGVCDEHVGSINLDGGAAVGWTGCC